MFQYRQVLARLRQGDSERDIARSRLMGRRKVSAFRALAARQGWLVAGAALPDDAEISAAVGKVRRSRSTISSAEPHRALIERWDAEGVSGVAIHAALCREHGYTGSYSAVHRLLAAVRANRPPEATVPLSFAPGEAAQVDFGTGPRLCDAAGVAARAEAPAAEVRHDRRRNDHRCTALDQERGAGVSSAIQ
jgi:hypothetical protein